MNSLLFVEDWIPRFTWHCTYFLLLLLLLPLFFILVLLINLESKDS